MRKATNRRRAWLITCLATAGVGLAGLTLSGAATFALPAEAENGVLATGAASVNDSSASGGHAVRFGTDISPPVGSEQPVGLTGSWTRIFTDEFSGTALDTTKWAANWFGQTNMNGYQKLPGNISFSNGSVNLAVAADQSGAILTSNPYNGGGIGAGFQMDTDTFAEARILFPGNGTTIYNWPAWWTDGQSWPADGEIDIFEGLSAATTNYHYASGGTHVADNSGTIPGAWANGYHTYGVHRQAGKNDIYWDGKLVRSYGTHDNGAPQYLLLTNGAGHQTVTGEASKMKVDYVRVWQQ